MSMTLKRLTLLETIDEDALAHLVEGHFPHLEYLELPYVQLTENALKLLALRPGMMNLKTLAVADKTSIPTGGTDRWYDQGYEVGSSPETFQTYQVVPTYFAGQSVKVVAADQTRAHVWRVS
jgi:hypothetical protein